MSWPRAAAFALASLCCCFDILDFNASPPSTLSLDVEGLNLFGSNVERIGQIRLAPLVHVKPLFVSRGDVNGYVPMRPFATAFE